MVQWSILSKELTGNWTFINLQPNSILRSKSSEYFSSIMEFEEFLRFMPNYDIIVSCMTVDTC